MIENRKQIMFEHSYQNWDKGETAKSIDSYWMNSTSERNWRSFLVSNIKAEFGGRPFVLDVGCGSGLIYAEMIKFQVITAKTYVGGDISPKMLEMAHNRFLKLRLINLDIFRLPFREKTQPYTICIHVLQHLPDYAEALKELIRITSKRLLIGSWFTQGPEDNKIFEDTPWGAPFYNNRYYLPKFLNLIFEHANGRIEKISVTKYREPTYIISMTFG
jgi:ubiquinone/menaquinone biosynthesis C-methylase UbiE